MATLQNATKQEIFQSRRLSKRSPLNPIGQQPEAVELPLTVPANKIRDSYLKLETFSPVNQNGSFEFDRVLKSGVVQKRTRKTKVPLSEHMAPSILTYHN